MNFHDGNGQRILKVNLIYCVEGESTQDLLFVRDRQPGQ